MAGHIGHVAWLIADALPTKWSHGQPSAIRQIVWQEKYPAQHNLLHKSIMILTQGPTKGQTWINSEKMDD